MSYNKISNYILNDILSRFILNSPESEHHIDRIGFKLQKAYWYYKDFCCKKKDHIAFEEFINVIMLATPFLRSLPYDGIAIKKRFEAYSSKIPRYGCIILNQDRTKILLIVNNQSKRFSFPKGKINYNESPLDCAVRETMEEIGYNVSNYIKPDDCIQHSNKQGSTNCYFIADKVDDSIAMEPQARNEIDEIRWVDIAEIKRNRNEIKYSTVIELLDAIQLIIKERIVKERKVYQQMLHKETFSDSIRSKIEDLDEFCQGDCKTLTLDLIEYFESSASEENPFLNFSFTTSISSCS